MRELATVLAGNRSGGQADAVVDSYSSRCSAGAAVNPDVCSSRSSHLRAGHVDESSSAIALEAYSSAGSDCYVQHIDACAAVNDVSSRQGRGCIVVVDAVEGVIASGTSEVIRTCSARTSEAFEKPSKNRLFSTQCE